MEYACRDCGHVFVVYCQDELDKKLKLHKCHIPNKRAVRTEKLVEQVNDQIVHNIAVEEIQQQNFNKLVKQGTICCV